MSSCACAREMPAVPTMHDAKQPAATTRRMDMAPSCYWTRRAHGRRSSNLWQSMRVMRGVLAAVLAAGMWATLAPLGAQTRATATNVPVIAHQAVANFFKNPPGIYTGENMGIATNSKGQIYIYHRANETRLFEYSPQGNF